MYYLNTLGFKFFCYRSDVVYQKTDMLCPACVECSKSILTLVWARLRTYLLDKFYTCAVQGKDMSNFYVDFLKSKASLKSKAQHVLVPTNRRLQFLNDKREVVNLFNNHYRPPPLV